jgi:hypothetical protein
MYMNANLREGLVAGRPSLVTDDIDPQRTDAFGRNNAARMREGLVPLDESGRPFVLHNIGQSDGGAVAELKENVHVDRESLQILHPRDESFIERVESAAVHSAHWKARAEQLGWN